MTLYITDPFSSINDENKSSLMHSFFSTETYKQIKTTETAFEAAQSSEQNLILLRMNATVALAHILYFITLMSMMAASIAITICINPIAGFVVLGLAASFMIYNLIKFDRDVDNWVKHFTEINEQINLGSEQDLFPELDQLVQLTNSDGPEPSPSATKK